MLFTTNPHHTFPHAASTLPFFQKLSVPPPRPPASRWQSNTPFNAWHPLFPPVFCCFGPVLTPQRGHKFLLCVSKSLSSAVRRMWIIRIERDEICRVWPQAWPAARTGYPVAFSKYLLIVLLNFLLTSDYRGLGILASPFFFAQETKDSYLIPRSPLGNLLVTNTPSPSCCPRGGGGGGGGRGARRSREL